jgi:large subunit GTPase 1
MKPGGIPDHSRAARIVLKDFVQGKLIFCQAPPSVQQVTQLAQ